MSIRQLPDHVVDQLESASAITCLNAVVCGLLKNSLDAGCTRANIHINYLHGNCSVQDDGLGIEPCEFKDGGGLAKPHHTSRITPSSSSCHGSRGDFLASVANMSLLSIISHHAAYMSHGHLSIHNSNVLARQMPAPPDKCLEVFSHGTHVSVRSLFGSMPVRVKHRATVFSERSAIDKEWRTLVRHLVALLLAWPSEVSLSLTETAIHRHLRLRSALYADMCARTSSLLTQASLANSADAVSWVPVSVCNSHLRIKGCISTRPVASRRSQLMSLGIRPILDDHNFNVLYESVNHVFANSAFGLVQDENGGDGEATVKSRKGPDKWPMFYFHITLISPEKPLGHTLIGDKVLDNITMLIHTACHDFLQKQHLRPRALNRRAPTRQAAKRRNNPSGLSQSATPLDSTASLSGTRLADQAMLGFVSPFEDWHRIKIGVAAPRREAKSPRNSRRMVGEGGKLLRLPFENLPDVSSNDETQTQGGGSLGGDGPVKRSKRLRIIDKSPKPQPSPWLQSVLTSWENPVFEIAQGSIPRLYEDATPLDTARCSPSSRHVNLEAKSMSLAGRVSKSALTNAEVIGQVDRKFILVKLPLESVVKRTVETNQPRVPALVMIDQHAADERCKLEELMAGYFERKPTKGSYEAVVERLEQPMVFEVADQEGEMLQRYHGHFASWGIHYSVQRGRREQHTAKMCITQLPTSIVERCRSEPRLTIDLVRKEIWLIHDETKTCSLPYTGDEAGRPPRPHFHGCPAGILDLLYSRSCRSAIMFNDELSREQCQQLVRQLAQCAFPFQCAHGRPSMVPLADLGTGHDAVSWQHRRHSDLSMWKKWLQSSQPSHVPLS
ncbi:hypothetical protein CDD82_5406 [Ophiocordyceps australis]|uniref:MutL C-terminal dimerisation domain-containing protein n=1 Tax=Ophiocordyceps australis TaxID=1399860 RepID=A0A2C5Z0G0_9HYPO|nr:hypothetical protein CDD82_5406 [Ophiocordyceps australis]